MKVVQQIVIGATLLITAQFLIVDLSLARVWGAPCYGSPPSCFSVDISRDGSRVTLTNECDEELAVVPTMGEDEDFPITAVRAGQSRTRSHPTWEDPYDGVVCCTVREPRYFPAGDITVYFIVNPCLD